LFKENKKKEISSRPIVDSTSSGISFVGCLVVAFDFASSRANRVVFTRPPMTDSSGIYIEQGKINMSFIFDHQKKRGRRERACPVGRKNLIGNVSLTLFPIGRVDFEGGFIS
jgi:hypothetical protein